MEFNEDMFDLMLDKLPGINLAEGVVRLGGNKAKYIKILSLFLNSQTKVMASILEIETENERAILVHSCKGAGSNMGAELISQAASVLEEKYNTGIPVSEEEIRSLQKMLNEALGIFDEIAKKSTTQILKETKEETLLSDNILKEQLQYLQTSLQEFDIEVGDKFTELQKKLPQWFCEKSEFKKLEAAITQFDFIMAEEHLKTLNDQDLFLEKNK